MLQDFFVTSFIAMTFLQLEWQTIRCQENINFFAKVNLVSKISKGSQVWPHGLVPLTYIFRLFKEQTKQNVSISLYGHLTVYLFVVNSTCTRTIKIRVSRIFMLLYSLNEINIYFTT